MDFQIKTYTPPQLLEFINSEEFKHLDNYPITRHRALSHINNPRSSDTDKILYIAFENSKVVGYRLIMVDNIIINNTPEKIGWYSCVWVHPNKRGTGIAKKLVEISLTDWGNNIIFQGPVTESKNLYISTNIFNEVFITGLRAYIRFDINEVMNAKYPKLKPFSFLFKLSDNFFNVFIDLFSSLKPNKPLSDNIEFVTDIDNELDIYIQKHQAKNLFKRSKSDLNWILQYPWILSSNTTDHISKNYYFSSIAKKFEFIIAKIYNSTNQIDGFVMLQIRNNHLTVELAYFEKNQVKVVVELIYYILKQHKINVISIYEKDLIEHMSIANPFIFKKQLKRGFYYSKNFEHYFKKNPQLSFEAGDGDMIFT